MKKSKRLELDNETIERIITIAQEEKKPFEMIKLDFGVSEKEVTEIMKKRLAKDQFEIWKKKTAANKPKQKPLKFNPLEDDDLDTKYYIKNKFD